MAYGFIGSMQSQPGKRDEMAQILVDGAAKLGAAGCQQYTIAVDPSDENTIWVTVVWMTKEAHDDALELPEVKEQIGKARPLIAGAFTRTETDVRGGLGLTLA